MKTTYELKRMLCTKQEDGFSCGILTMNTINHYLDPLRYPLVSRTVFELGAARMEHAILVLTQHLDAVRTLLIPCCKSCIESISFQIPFADEIEDASASESDEESDDDGDGDINDGEGSDAPEVVEGDVDEMVVDDSEKAGDLGMVMAEAEMDRDEMLVDVNKDTEGEYIPISVFELPAQSIQLLSRPVPHHDHIRR